MSRIEKSERHLRLSDTWPSCSGPCDQGRKGCFTPDACRLPEPLFAKCPSASAAVAISLVMACAAIALILSGVWS